MIQALGDRARNLFGAYAKDERGSATIEFMVTLPLLLVAFVFAFEFSRLFWAHHIAVTNVRDAVRYLSRAPLTATYLDRARNIARTGNPNTAVGAYEWMAAIQDSDIDIQESFSTFTDSDFRTGGQVIRIRMDVPFTFSTFDMMNTFTRGNMPGVLTLNIIEEARYIGE